MWGRKKQNPSRQPGQRRSTASGRNGAVFSYYQNRVIPGDESVSATKARESKQLRSLRTKHIPTIISLVIVVLCFGYILSLSQNPKIIIVNQQEEATQSLLRPIETYQEAGKKILQKSPLNKTKLLINTSGVQRDIQEQFPEVSKATISLPLINRRPVIYLQITQPVLLLRYGSDTYALDDQGRIIMKGDSTLPHSELAVVEDQNSTQPEVGKAFLPSNQIAFMQEVSSQLKAKGINNFSFTLPPLANEVYVKPAEQPYYIKMTFSNDARTQVGTYLAVRQKLEADKIAPREYVDVRVDERAYYK